MDTSRTTSTRGARRRPRAATLGALILIAVVAAAIHQVIPDARQLEGEVLTKVHLQEPDALEAAFPREAYRPGSTAILRTWTAARGVSLQIHHVGPERMRTLGSNDMQGVPMTPVRRLGAVRNGSRISIDVGNWRSGLYFAKLTAAGKVGYAPFFVRPRRLGENRVAVVLPTRTWQAYNHRSGDTWYADSKDNTVILGRPHLNRGVPFRFRAYDLYFLNWLHRTGKRVDILSQSELEVRRNPGSLRRAYDLIVFPGHHEYVTETEYDAVESFRDRGGSLMFLSANNFFWRIDISGNVMTRVRKWRELGRPEAALIGVQYIANDDGRARGAWLVEPSHRRSWLFRGVKLGGGVRFSNGGIEIDKTSSASPRGTQVVAQIPNLLGRGLTGQMTYYRTRGGAQVFASGAFTLAGAVRQPTVARLLENVWGQFTHAHEPEERTLAAVAPVANEA
jgi:hypothetical protein